MMFFRLRSKAAGVLVVAVVSCFSATAQPVLDSSFGTNSVAAVVSPGYEIEALIRCVTLQSDGKVLVAGQTSSQVGTPLSEAPVSLMRFNANGTPDATFNGGAPVIIVRNTGTAAGFKWNTVRSVVVQPDGKILVVGSFGSPTASRGGVLRLNADGSTDGTFGTGGFVSVELAGFDAFLRWALLQPDGKIVVLGARYQLGAVSGSNMLAARLNADGSFDTSFGQGGISLVPNVPTATNGAFCSTGLLDAQGRIIIAGGSDDSHVQMVRLNANGSVDASFASAGVLRYPTPDISFVSSIEQLPDGKLLGAVFINNFQPAVFRINSNGTLDNTFGASGIYALSPGVNNSTNRLLVKPDGSSYLTGNTDPSTGTQRHPFVVFGIAANGMNDASWGNNGTLIVNAMGDSPLWANFSVLQPDGNILLGGQQRLSGGQERVAVARLLTSGTVGVLGFDETSVQASIYPNPVGERVTLEYTLNSEETLSIYLTDLNGKTHAEWMRQVVQSAGDYRQEFSLPVQLPSGVYLIAFDNGKYVNTVRVVKL